MNSTERKAFYAAKQKEFESSFQSKEWTFDGTQNAEQSRILRARFLLSSEKNSDGTPRAKARLIVQGFRDPDAFGGSLSTASPTLTRLSRNFIMAIAAMQNFQLSQRTLPRPSCRELNVQKILTESFGSNYSNCLRKETHPRTTGKTWKAHEAHEAYVQTM